MSKGTMVISKNIYGKTLDEVAIERLKIFEDNAIAKNANGYYVAYSGGKDSDVVLDLVRRSGVKYEAHHHLTTADPPEVVRHIKQQPDVIINKPELTMWQLIRKKKMPPRRQARYCCETQKERRGVRECIVVTGVRWGESNKRAKRRMVETCFKDKSKKYLHPIIDWSTTDVWEYIKHRKIIYCSLYDEGFKRLGCVLCPMVREIALNMHRWPKLCRAWERAVKATYVEGKTGFRNAEEYWQWWLDRDAPSKKVDSDQMLFFRD